MIERVWAEAFAQRADRGWDAHDLERGIVHDADQFEMTRARAARLKRRALRR